MKNLQRLLLLNILLAMVAFASTFLVVQAQEGRQGERSAQMRRKLDHSGMILEGISTENFEAISQGTAGLRKAGEAAKWHVLPTDDYLRFASEFRRLLDRLDENAAAEDLEGATLSYVELTLNCVNCHKFVRISQPQPEPRGNSGQ